jgi:hypothetical protein
MPFDWVTSYQGESHRPLDVAAHCVGSCPGVGREEEVACKRLTLLMLHHSSSAVADLLSWSVLCLRCHWQHCHLSRDCWIFIPGNEARNRKRTAGFSDHRLGLQSLEVGRERVIFYSANWTVRLEVKIHKIEEGIPYLSASSSKIQLLLKKE